MQTFSLSELGRTALYKERVARACKAREANQRTRHRNAKEREARRMLAFGRELAALGLDSSEEAVRNPSFNTNPDSDPKAN